MSTTTAASIGPHPNLHVEFPVTITQDIFTYTPSGLSRTTTSVTCPCPPCQILAATSESHSAYSTAGGELGSDALPDTLSSPTAPVLAVAVPAPALAAVPVPRTLRERRRASSLFGKAPFRFKISSRRRPSSLDLSIQPPSSKRISTSSGASSVSSEPISPTTTIFPCSESKTKSTLEPKVAVESTEHGEQLGLSICKSVSIHDSTADRNARSAPGSIVLTSPIEFKAHPGTLVEFSSISEPCLGTPLVFKTRPSSMSSRSSSASSSDNVRSVAQDYHRYLRDVNNAKARAKARSEKLPQKDSRDFDYSITLSGAQLLENIDYKERKADRRIRSLEIQAQLLREGPCAISAPSPGSEARKGSAESSGGSDGSTESVLNHIRRSFEARKMSGGKKPSYDVFKDEVEKGFLDGVL